MDHIPIIIDNGSYQCRAGFANNEPQLIFKNLVAKLRKERGKKDVDVQVGNEIENLDNVRFALKSQFDRNVAIHMDIQETIFDYLFSSLTTKTLNDNPVDHPVVLSEPFLNPNYCRKLMAELLFEHYQIPALAYGVDALFSFNRNFPSSQDALIVSLGYHTMHILPLLDGKVDCSNGRRINIGGAEITSFLHRLIKLKYPAHTNFMTFVKVEDLLHNSGYVAKSYMEELEKWTNVDFYNQRIIRIPLPAKSQISVSQAETLKERRKEIAKKMVEINARKREEKLAEDEERLEILSEIKMLADEDGDVDEVERALRAANVTNMTELIKAISALQSSIYRVKNRNSKPEVTTTTTVTGEPNSKKHRDSTDPPQDREKFDAYISNVRVKRTEILKKRAQRRQRRTDMAKRRTAAAQDRMRILSQLARKEKHDTFGMRDSDWDVYKSIQKDGGGSDSEEKEEQEELNELEQVLKRHDPAFNESQKIEAKGHEHEHELHIGLEIVRAPELIFQPSMVGDLQGGLAETIEHILKLYPDNTQRKLVSNVFLTGGLAACSGVLQRLEHQMLEMRPFESTFQVHRATNPVLDPWLGMRDFALNSNNAEYFISRAEYDEKGPEYLKEHFCSNRYFSASCGDATATLEGTPILQMIADIE